MALGIRRRLGYFRQVIFPGFLTRMKSGSTVYAGLFRGMTYVKKSLHSAYAPKLLGTYEIEIAPIIEQHILNGNIKRVCDVGAAEGYYAVGLACRKKELHVIAFEMDHAARELLTQLAKANNVDKQIDLREKCDPAKLAELLNEELAFVIVDVEGYESILLDPKLVPGLKNSPILVEIHEKQRGEVAEVLRERFDPTHICHTIEQQIRPADSARRGFNKWLRSYLENEHRTIPFNYWMFLEPR